MNRPAVSIAAENNGIAGLVVVCARCKVGLDKMTPNKAQQRLQDVCGKALDRPDRFSVAIFETIDQAMLACGMFQHPDHAADVVEMLNRRQ